MGDASLIAQGVDCYNQALVSIGQGTIVSQGASLCAGTHNIESDDFAHEARPITICSHVWIAAEAFVGPGVTVGKGAVLGARAVAFRDIEEDGVYIGNPAQKIRSRATFHAKQAAKS